MNKEIKNIYKLHHKTYKKILKTIEKYDRIAVFRHIIPDFDALGTQLGLATWLKENFKSKDIKILGDNHVTFTPRLYPECDNVSDSWFNKPFLAIIVDVSNTSRIADPRWEKASEVIKLDHHPLVENFGNLVIVDTNMAAASELVANFLLTAPKKYHLSSDAAAYLYTGITGDSGRFQYSSTTTHTFIIASELLKKGISISKIYQKMYLKKIDDLKVTAYVLSHFEVSSKGVAYYVLPYSTQTELNITAERGKENVNIFSNIEGINAWCSISEDIKDHCWRVSIRSKEKAINGVATMFEGGGHDQASGAKLRSLDDLPKLIEALDNLF